MMKNRRLFDVGKRGGHVREGFQVVWGVENEVLNCLSSSKLWLLLEKKGVGGWGVWLHEFASILRLMMLISLLINNGFLGN